MNSESRNDGALIKDYIEDSITNEKQYEVVLSEGNNFVIRRRLQRYNELFVFNMDNDQYFIKNEKSGKITTGKALTETRISTFFKTWDPEIKVRNSWMNTSNYFFMYNILPAIPKRDFLKKAIRLGYTATDIMMSHIVIQCPTYINYKGSNKLRFLSKIDIAARKFLSNEAYERLPLDKIDLLLDADESFYSDLLSHPLNKEKYEEITDVLLKYKDMVHDILNYIYIDEQIKNRLMLLQDVKPENFEHLYREIILFYLNLFLTKKHGIIKDSLEEAYREASVFFKKAEEDEKREEEAEKAKEEEKIKKEADAEKDFKSSDGKATIYSYRNELYIDNKKAATNLHYHSSRIYLSDDVSIDEVIPYLNEFFKIKKRYGNCYFDYERMLKNDALYNL